MSRWCVFVCSAALAWCASPGHDFRHAAWGMNQAQVLATEANLPSDIRSSNGEVLVTYDAVRFGDLPARLIYIFADGRLVRAKYMLAAEHPDPDDFLADFRAIEPVLRETYGAPASERVLWEDDDHQIERRAYLDQDRARPSDLLPSDAFLGATLAAGHLKLYVQWENDRTTIVHGLAAVGGQIVHQIEYRSAAF